MAYAVFTNESVVVSQNGYSATPRAGSVAAATASSFDEAYDAANEQGGDRWVVVTDRKGAYVRSEYVPAV